MDDDCDEPEIFGMHNNANIAFQVRANRLLKYVSIGLTRSVGHRVGTQIFCLYLLSGQR